MELLTHLEPLTDAITRVRKGATAFSSNFFANRELSEAWLARGLLSYQEGPNCVLIFRKDRSFYRVYHAARDLAALAGQLASLGQTFRLREQVLISDLVGHSEDLCAVANVYQDQGFREYSCLFRMTYLTADIPAEDFSDDPGVLFATEADVPIVVEFLENQLNPFVDQIPDADDVRQAVVRRNVLMLRINDALAGLLVFESKGLTTILRYWYVSQDFRGQGAGARLIRVLFGLCRDAKRIVLWVVGSNTDSIAKYQHYGFKRDNIVDHIMMRVC